MTADEVEFAQEIAFDRNAKEESFGAMTYGGVRGSFEAHLLGILPEMAVASYYGVPIDDRTFTRHGDDGCDLLVPGLGVTQVKATTYSDDPWLRVEVEHDKPTIDSYLLSIVDLKAMHAVCLVGWIPRWMAITKPVRRLVDGGPMNYVVGESDLLDLPKPVRHVLTVSRHCVRMRGQDGAKKDCRQHC